MHRTRKLSGIWISGLGPSQKAGGWNLCTVFLSLPLWVLPVGCEFGSSPKNPVGKKPSVVKPDLCSSGNQLFLAGAATMEQQEESVAAAKARSFLPLSPGSGQAAGFQLQQSFELAKPVQTLIVKIKFVGSRPSQSNLEKLDLSLLAIKDSNGSGIRYRLPINPADPEHPAPSSFTNGVYFHALDLKLPANRFQLRLQGVGVQKTVQLELTGLFAVAAPGLQLTEAVPLGYKTLPDRVQFVPRQLWGAVEPSQPPRYTSHERIVVHHTADPYYLSTVCATRVRLYQKMHMEVNGWRDIGYQFLVCPDGKVFEGTKGGKGTKGIHARGVNDRTVAISVIGHYEQQVPTGKTLETLAALVSWLAKENSDLSLEDPPTDFGWPLQEELQVPLVVWHDYMLRGKAQNQGTTLCAGKHLIEPVRNGSILQRARQLAKAAPSIPQPTEQCLSSRKLQRRDQALQSAGELLKRLF